MEYIHPSIIHPHLVLFRGSAGVYPRSLLVKGRDTPWTGHQFVTGSILELFISIYYHHISHIHINHQTQCFVTVIIPPQTNKHFLDSSFLPFLLLFFLFPICSFLLCFFFFFAYLFVRSQHGQATNTITNHMI